MRQHPYRLHAVFFHRGGASGGHYWVYIYDHVSERWRKYNDDRVSIVDNRNEIFGKPDATNQNTWAPPNPYFLVYVAEDQIPNIVETVKREPIFIPPDGPPPLPDRYQDQQQQHTQQSQMSHMPPTADMPNGAYKVNSSTGGGGTYYDYNYDHGLPPSSQQQQQHQDHQLDGPSPSDVEMQEYREYQNSKPQAFKHKFPSEMSAQEKGQVQYPAVPRSGAQMEERVGNWDDSQADPMGRGHW
jgi:hypothetical protein